MIQIYKPTPKNTGSACSFYLSQDGQIMSNIIKQDSWNGKTASFQKNRGNPKASVAIKLSQTEVAGILNAVDGNKEFSSFHNSENQSVGIKFCPYIRDEKQVGFSYSVNKELKQNGEKVSFLVGIKFEEARLIKEYLTHALHKSFEIKSKAREQKISGPKEAVDNEQTQEQQNDNSW